MRADRATRPWAALPHPRNTRPVRAKRRGRKSQKSFADEILDRQAAERHALAHGANTGDRSARALAIDSGRAGRHKPGHSLAAARDDDLFAGLHPVEQLAEFGLGLEGADLLHTILKSDWFSVWSRIRCYNGFVQLRVSSLV